MEERITNNIPSSSAFKAVQSASIQLLSNLSSKELRTILPCLARAALCSPLDTSEKFRMVMKEIHRLMTGIESVNSIVTLLSVDFPTIREDAVKEQQLRKKLGGSSLVENILADSIQNGGLLSEFERSEPSRKIRLVLSEFLRLCALVSESKVVPHDAMELFDCAVYLQEISDILCIAFAELPDLLQIKDVADALLKLKFGPFLLCRLIGNAPDCFEQVCISILSNYNENSGDARERTKALKMLCTMNPSFCKTLRSEAISRCKLPGLAIELSICNEIEGRESDMVAFLTGLLLTSDSKVKEWLADYIRAAQRDNVHSSIYALRTQLLKDTNNVIKSFIHTQESQTEEMDVDSEEKVSDIAGGIAIMRLYCALKGMVGYKFSHEESDAFLQLITRHPPPTAGGVKFVVVGLCALLACTFIINNAEREEKATRWIEWLCSQPSDFGSTSAVNSSFGEMLLLIAIHFHNNNLEAIVDLVNTTLSMKLRLGSLTKMKILFSQQLFPEKVAAEHVLSVSVTRDLNANVSGFLPVNCVHQLLKSRVFTKHRVDVKDWIYNQICTSTAPLHPLMVPLIEAFVHSIILPIQVGKTGRHQKSANLERFAEQKVAEIFSQDLPEQKYSCKTTTQLLMLLYALSYQDYLLSNMSTLANNPKCPKEYSASLYTSIPIKQLFLKSKERQNLYEDLYPPLLRLITKNYPHLCLVEDCVFEEEIKEDSIDYASSFIEGLSTRQKAACTPSELKKALMSSDRSWPMAVILLSKLNALEPSLLVPFSETIVESLPHLLNDQVPRKVQTLSCSIWYKLNTEIPRRLWLHTVNIFCSSDKDQSSPRKLPYTDEEITKDPLIILRCDKRLFRCTPLFDILLRVLSAFMDASRACMSHHLQSHPIISSAASTNNNTAEREELKNALVAAQESAIVQILLEICLPLENEKLITNSAMMCNLREIQCRVCSFLHQIFIADPNMIKLVHFQGYPADLLSVTVAGIPSMHICLDFIPELLNMPQLEKQLFAVQLLSHLALQYPIPKSMSIAKHAVNRLVSLSAALPARKRTQFFLPIMPCLERICRAFPPLRDEIAELLVCLGNLTYVQLNKNSSTVLRIGSIITAESNDYEEDIDDDARHEQLQNKEIEFTQVQKCITNSTDSPLNQDEQLFVNIKDTFAAITKDTILGKLSLSELKTLNK